MLIVMRFPCSYPVPKYITQKSRMRYHARHPESRCYNVDRCLNVPSQNKGTRNASPIEPRSRMVHDSIGENPSPHHRPSSVVRRPSSIVRCIVIPRKDQPPSSRSLHRGPREKQNQRKPTDPFLPSYKGGLSWVHGGSAGYLLPPTPLIPGLAVRSLTLSSGGPPRRLLSST